MAQPCARMLAALSGLALLAGCSSQPMRLYEGPPRPATEIATLAIPEGVEVLKVNGTEVKSVLLRKGDLQLELAPGRYEVLAFYREIWTKGDQQDTVKSDPALFDLDASAGAHYRLEYVHPRSYGEALGVGKAFAGWIEDAAGNKTASRDSHLQFRRDFAAAFSAPMLVEKSGAAAGQAIAPLPPSSPPPASATAPAPSPGRLQAMKDWWTQATPDERGEFMKWVGQR